MPTEGDYDIRRTSEAIAETRRQRIAKWKARGCSDNKIQELIFRRINSTRQKW